MPIVHIQMLAGRPPERIRELMARVTDAVCTALEVPPEGVRVIVSEIPRTHWAVGGRPMPGEAPANDPPGPGKGSP